MACDVCLQLVTIYRIKHMCVCIFYLQGSPARTTIFEILKEKKILWALDSNLFDCRLLTIKVHYTKATE